MHITFVKKVLLDGSSCAQCEAVFKQLVADGFSNKINHVVLADARDNQSPGMVLALKHNVSQAPFFIIENRSNSSDQVIVSDQAIVTVLDCYTDFKNFISKLN